MLRIKIIPRLSLFYVRVFKANILSIEVTSIQFKLILDLYFNNSLSDIFALKHVN